MPLCVLLQTFFLLFCSRLLASIHILCFWFDWWNDGKLSLIWSTSVTRICQCDFVPWGWSTVCTFLKVEKKPTPFVRLFTKIESRPRCSSAYRHVFLSVCLITVSGHGSARHQLLFMCAVGFFTCVLPGREVWGKASIEAASFSALV